VAAGVKSVWRRLNGVGSKEVLALTLTLTLTLPLPLPLPLTLPLSLPLPQDELIALQREAKALLGLRAEATKLRP